MFDIPSLKQLADEINAITQDEQCVLDTLEGETDVMKYVDSILYLIDDCDITIEGCKISEKRLNDRRERNEAKKERLRGLIGNVMNVMQVKKLSRPTATISLNRKQPKIVVSNPDLLPDGLCKIERIPVMSKIKELETLPDGCTMDNGRQSLTIRRS